MLAYERQGAGAPLVLLHGLGHRRQAWQTVMPMLAAEHDVIAVDLPGFGESAPPPGYRWREDLAPAIAAFMDELGLERPHVAGNSLGGALALELAIAGKVASATALAPAGFWTESERRITLVKLRALRACTFIPLPAMRLMVRSTRLRTLAYGMVAGRPDRLEPQTILEDALAMRQASRYMAVARCGKGYAVEGTPQCPITIAWGTKDRILSPHQLERARRRFPEAQHAELDGCGHVPMSDDPERVAELILDTTKAAGRP